MPDQQSIELEFSSPEYQSGELDLFNFWNHVDSELLKKCFVKSPKRSRDETSFSSWSIYHIAAQPYRTHHDIWIEESEVMSVADQPLKSRLIEQQRALLVANQMIRHLQETYLQIQTILRDAVSANKSLQAALIGKSEGAVCLYERHVGVAAASFGNEIQIVYDTPEGPLKQMYSVSQFMAGKVPECGDSVEAYVLMCVRPFNPEESLPELPKKTNKRNFREKDTTDTVIF
jgi:hypothetical protein